LFGKGVNKVERELAGASSEEAFKIWNKQGPIGKLHNICVYVNTNSTRQTVFKGSQGMNFRSIDFSWMEEFGGIPLRQ
jgi:hypothetical protein